MSKLSPQFRKSEASKQMRNKKTETLTPELLRWMDGYWRAATYLSVGHISLSDKALSRKPLKLQHVKPRLLGHLGTTPGMNFIYVHLNRAINEHGLKVIYIAAQSEDMPEIRNWKWSQPRARA